MQVFVPSPTLSESVQVLDQKRLGKQRVETYQIMLVLLGLGPDKDNPGQFVEREPKGWRSHPAVLAWQNNLGGLYRYQVETCAEWTGRGYKDTCLDKTFAAMTHRYPDGPPNFDLPRWWGYEPVHASHRAALLHKDPEWYSQFGWGEAPVYDYVWPHELEEYK